MPIAYNEINEKSNGGTELQIRRLEKIIPKELLDKVQIIPSRLRELDTTKHRIFYCHDLPGDPESDHLKNNGWDKFHRIIFVSHWQKQQYQNYFGIPASKCVVIQNAIDPIDCDFNKFKSPEMIKIIYHSTPHRGLKLLVPVFKKLKEEYSNIELNVYSSFNLYGWAERDKEYQELFDQIKSSDGMNYHGTVSNEDVRNAVSQSHIFAYPSIWPESSCQIAGALILTKNGVKSIENIKIGDYVMSHLGNFKKVTELHKRPYNGKLIGLRSVGSARSVYFTPNHLMYVGIDNDIKSMTWKSVESLDNNLVVRPKQNFGNLKEINIIDYMDLGKFHVVNDKVQHIKTAINYKTIQNNQPLTKEFAYVLGAFAGDGSATTISTRNHNASAITFAHHVSEKFVADKICSFFKDTCKTIVVSENEYRTVYYNAIWSRFFNNVIGVGRNKKIPDFIWDASKEIQESFLQGYFDTDGHCSKVSGTPRDKITSISPSLAYGLSQILTNMGYFSSLNFHNDREAYEISWRELPEHKLYKENDSYIGSKIYETNTIEYIGYVYNFEVEDDRSYVTENIAVHNCLCLMEAMSAGCICVHSDFAALPETASNWTAMYSYNENIDTHATTFYHMMKPAIEMINNNKEDMIVNKLRGQKSYTDLFYSWDLRKYQWINLISAILSEPLELQDTSTFKYEVNI